MAKHCIHVAISVTAREVPGCEASFPDVDPQNSGRSSAQSTNSQHWIRFASFAGTRSRPSPTLIPAGLAAPFTEPRPGRRLQIAADMPSLAAVTTGVAPVVAAVVVAAVAPDAPTDSAPASAGATALPAPKTPLVCSPARQERALCPMAAWDLHRAGLGQISAENYPAQSPPPPPPLSTLLLPGLFPLLLAKVLYQCLQLLTREGAPGRARTSHLHLVLRRLSICHDCKSLSEPPATLSLPQHLSTCLLTLTRPRGSFHSVHARPIGRPPVPTAINLG